MTFDKILDDGRLWAVRYDGKKITASKNYSANGTTCYG